MVNVTFECIYCHKNYQRESSYLKHVCPIKTKLEQSKSPLGQAAYMFYAKWMHSCKRSIPENSTFLNSKFYESFIKFAKFNKAVQLPSVDLYIHVMNSKKITPELWTDDRAYGIYLEHMEHHVDPLMSIKITSTTLEKVADEYECDISEVFTKCAKNEVIQLIRERKLSPWILLRSTKFKEFVGSLGDEQLRLLENLIDSNFWKAKFKKDPKTLNFVKNCIVALGL